MRFCLFVTESRFGKMKIAIVLLAIIGLGLSAPQPRKLFHEHFDDFMTIIREEAGQDMENLLEHYVEYDEFLSAFDYIRTNNFKDLVYEMEHLPEFQAVSYHFVFFLRSLLFLFIELRFHPLEK